MINTCFNCLDVLFRSFQAVEKRPSAALPSSFVVATYIQVRLTPQDFGRPRRGGISQSSTCICLPAEASAQAGAFLTSLQKKTFPTGSFILTLPSSS